MLARPTFFDVLSEKLRQTLLADRDHLVIWAPILFALGIGFYFSFGQEPAHFYVWLVFAACLLPALVLKPLKDRFFALWLMSIAFLWVAAGVFLAQARTDTLQTPLLKRDMNGVAFEATIKQIDQLEAGKGVRILLSDVHITNRRNPPALHNIRLTVREPADIHVGDRIAGKGSLFPPAAPVLPQSYDFQRHAYFQGISAYGFMYHAPTILQPSKLEGWSAMMERARTEVGHVVYRVLDDRIAPITVALLTGERAAILDDDWQALRNSGLAHLLAISGLNVDMTAGVVFFAVRFLLSLWPWFVLRFPVKKIAAGFALIAACLYVSFIVPSVPSQRALLMAAIVLLAVMLDRSPISMRLLALTALFILMIWPEQLLSPNFQMSFAAVAALIGFFEAFQDRLSILFRSGGPVRRMSFYLVGVVLTTIIATLATAPISLFHFQSLSVYGVLANALAVPIMTFVIMPLATLCYVLLPFGAADWALSLIGWGVEWTLAIAHWVASLPHAVFKPAAFPSLAFILFMMAGVFLLVFKGKAQLLCLIPFMACVFVFIRSDVPDLVVAASGKQVIVRVDQHTLWAASRVHEKRWLEDVQQALGLADGATVTFFPRQGRIEHGPYKISCDKQSCLYVAGTQKVAFTKQTAAFAEDCVQADIVFALTFDPARMPCGARVIHRDDLRYKGTHTLVLDGLHIDHVAQNRGNRPWVATNQ